MLSFADFGLPADVVSTLAARGITETFPIQSLTLADACAGRDLCGKAPTGSGKTLAFGIPLVTRLGRANPRRPRGLVLAPTRELASQIAAELSWLGAARKCRAAAVYGGAGFGAQTKALRKGVDILVACPGRLTDLLQRGELTLDEVEIVVVDEADRMADMGFLPAVRRLLDDTPKSRQTLLFSATLDGAVDVLVRNYQRQPARHELADSETRATHAFWKVGRDDRVDLTAQIIHGGGATIVFCRTKHGTDALAKKLDRLGVRSEVLHGNRSQGQRERALKAFADGEVDALVATDVAARGIHVDNVASVVQFDLPADPKDYTHRAGRTARAGCEGRVVTFVTHDQVRDAARLQRALGFEATLTAPALTGTDAPSPAASMPVPAIPKLPTGPRGVVKWFDPRRGFGFIEQHGGADVFVHHSDLVDTSARAMKPGQTVAFEMARGPKGDAAVQVRVLAATA
jgi:superfamily II DNA/RNA helicase/cold shock CspA family protein